MAEGAEVDGDQGALGLMMEFQRTGNRYAYLLVTEIVAVEDGATVGGKPTCRVVLIRGECIYPVDVLGRARDIAVRLHVARKEGADSFAYAMLSHEGKSTLEARVRDAVVRAVQATLRKEVKVAAERIVPEAVAVQLSRLAAEPHRMEEEPAPPAEEPKDRPGKRRRGK